MRVLLRYAPRSAKTLARRLVDQPRPRLPRQIRHIRAPFKGFIHYEWQLGPIVFQVKHRELLDGATAAERDLWHEAPWLHVMHDPYWRQS